MKENIGFAMACFLIGMTGAGWVSAVTVDVPAGTELMTNGTITATEVWNKSGDGTLTFVDATAAFGGKNLNVLSGGIRVTNSTLTGINYFDIGATNYPGTAFTFQSGRIEATGQIVIGAHQSTTAAVQTGGDLVCANTFFFGGYPATGTGTGVSRYDQQGGTVTVGDLNYGGAGGNGGTYNLTGGTLAVRRVAWSYAKTSILLLGGGTLAGRSNQADFLDSRLGAVTLTGAATIDTGSYTLGVQRAMDGTGSLTKTGTGVLDFMAAQTYTGKTTVEAGTLAVRGTIASSGIEVKEGAAVQLFKTNVPSWNLGALTLGNGAALVFWVADSNGAAISFAPGTYTLATCSSLTVSDSATITVVGLDASETGTVTADTANNRILLNVASSASYIWTGAASTTWSASAGGNWNGGAAPISTGDRVTFPTLSGTASQTVTIGEALTLGDLYLASSTAYTLSGGQLTLAAFAGKMPSVTVVGGSHTFAMPVVLNDAAAISVSTNQALALTGAVSGSAPLVISGGGAVTANNTGSTFTGDVVVSNATLKLYGGVSELNPTHGSLGNLQSEGRVITIRDGGGLFCGAHDLFGYVHDSSTMRSAPSTTKVQWHIGPNGTLRTDNAFNCLSNIVLDAGTIRSGDKANNNYWSFALLGDIQVVGTAASTLAASTLNGGMQLDSPFTTFTVADVTGNSAADFNVIAPFGDSCGSSPMQFRRAGWLKRGAGTMRINCPSFNTGTNIVAEGIVQIALRLDTITNGTAWGATAAGAVAIQSNAVVTVTENDTMGSHVSDIGRAIIIEKGGTLTSEGRFTTIGPLVLRGGTFSGKGGVNDQYQMWNLTKPVTVAGSVPSRITSASTSRPGIHILGDITLDVADVTGDGAADLSIDTAYFIGAAGLNPTDINSGALIKTGAGTVSCTSYHPFTGPFIISNGTWIVNASCNSDNPTATGLGSTQSTNPVVIAEGATLKLINNDEFGSRNSDIKRKIVIRGTLESTGKFSTLGELSLEGGTLYNSAGVNQSYEMWQLSKPVTVAGDKPSFITAGSATYDGVHLKGTSVPFIVSNVTADAAVDLTVDAVLRGFCEDPNGNNAGQLIKRGDGTMRLKRDCICNTATAVEEGALIVDAGLTSTETVSVSGGAAIGGSGTLNGGLTVAENGGFVIIDSNQAKGLTVNGTLTLPTIGTIRVEHLDNRTVYPVAASASFAGAASLKSWVVTGKTENGEEKIGIAVVSGGALKAYFPAGTIIRLK